MEPNEMSNEELIFKYFYSGCDNAGEHATMAVEIQNRLRTIDGMIKRPNVEVYEMTHPGGGTCYQPVINKYLVGELTAYPDNAKREAMHLALALGVSYDMTLTTALGMDDAKEGGRG